MRAQKPVAVEVEASIEQNNNNITVIWKCRLQFHLLALVLVFTNLFTHDSIYAITPMCYRPSVRLSVCPSVRWVYHRKTVEVRTMKFSPYSTPSVKFLQVKFHLEILRGSPRAGNQTREGWVKSAVFYI